ncbi:MAG: HNH endonuclease [Lachnospiraceae bacterium]|nr:HNH endonuclease [Lachnospiraceae bacterium]
MEEDFHLLCGYCGKDGKVMREKFHIDHFVPQRLDEERKNDYYNLVLACPRCNLSKSDKWPTKDKNCSHNEEQGFVDPVSGEYDQHMQRDKDGYVVGITPVGKSMCNMLHLDIRRTDLYWKINLLRDKQKELENLYKEGKLTEKEKDFYIETNMILNDYVDEAFIKGE